MIVPRPKLAPKAPKVPSKPQFKKFRQKVKLVPKLKFFLRGGPWADSKLSLRLIEGDSTMVISVGGMRGRYHRNVRDLQTLEWQDV